MAAWEKKVPCKQRHPPPAPCALAVSIRAPDRRMRPVQMIDLVDFRMEVPPLRIQVRDQPDLPQTRISLQAFLATNGENDVGMPSEPDQPLGTILAREASPHRVTMLPGPSLQIARHAVIDDTALPVRHHVDKPGRSGLPADAPRP